MIDSTSRNGIASTKRYDDQRARCVPIRSIIYKYPIEYFTDNLTNRLRTLRHAKSIRGANIEVRDKDAVIMRHEFVIAGRPRRRPKIYNQRVCFPVYAT